MLNFNDSKHVNTPKKSQNGKLCTSFIWCSKTDQPTDTSSVSIHFYGLSKQTGAQSDWPSWTSYLSPVLGTVQPQLVSSILSHNRQTWSISLEFYSIAWRSQPRYFKRDLHKNGCLLDSSLLCAFLITTVCQTLWGQNGPYCPKDLQERSSQTQLFVGLTSPLHLPHHYNVHLQ